MPRSAKQLDELDRLLLVELQRDNQVTADQLAERVGRSASAVARRVRRLRETHAIVGDISIVSEAAAGQPLSAIVHLQLERHALNEGEAFRRRLIASPNVQFCLEISGTFDILLLVAVADMDAFNAFADDMLASARAVSRYESSFVKRRLKASLALPITPRHG